MIIDKILDRLTDYLRLKAESLKLELTGHIARILSHLIIFILITLIGFFFSFFLMLMIAVVLNHVLDSSYLGYIIVTGFLLILLVAVGLTLKSGKIQKWLETLIIKLSEDNE